MENPFPACAFWDFSLAVYGREDVAPACLRLQERHGIDVNLLLFCCWCGATGRGVLDAAALAAAQKAAERWHAEIVRSLRAMRARLKRAPDLAPADWALFIRKRIGAIEIEAEHVEQLMLAEHAPPAKESARELKSRAHDAAQNAIRYLQAVAHRFEREDRADLLAVLAGCFPELSAAALREIVDSAGA